MIPAPAPATHPRFQSRRGAFDRTIGYRSSHGRSNGDIAQITSGRRIAIAARLKRWHSFFQKRNGGSRENSDPSKEIVHEFRLKNLSHRSFVGAPALLRAPSPPE
jgi:hypothetical protein